MSTQPIPVFDPQGILRDIPSDQLAQAVKAGGMPAVRFQAPDKTVRFVPADRTQDAVKAGGQILPFEQQDVKHPGFWSALVDDAKGMAAGGAKTLIAAGTGNPAAFTDQALQTAATVSDNMQHRRDEGRSLAYRTVAPVGDALGVNTRGMEDAADAGDVGGVAGHAAAVPAVMAATEGVARGVGLAANIAKNVASTPESFLNRAARTGGKMAAGAAEDVPVVRQLAKVRDYWEETAPKKIAPATDELDATGENKPYAGAAPPRKYPANYYDATGENKPFAGGVDELKIPARTEAAPPAATPAATPAKAPGQAGSLADSVAKPAASEIPDRYNGEAQNDARLQELERSNDPLLAKLRSTAARLPEDEPAAATVKPSAKKSTVRIPEPDEDLVGILQDSLKHFQAKQAANQ